MLVHIEALTEFSIIFLLLIDPAAPDVDGSSVIRGKLCGVRLTIWSYSAVAFNALFNLHRLGPTRTTSPYENNTLDHTEAPTEF